MAVYKNEKTGKWFCAFYFKDYDGKNKKKKKEGFGLRREAVEWENDYKNRMSGITDITFKNLSAEYIKDCQYRQKPTTVLTKKSTIEKILNPYFGNMKISEINAKIVRNWQNTKMIDGHIKISTARYYNATLQTVFGFGCRYYGLKSNPLKTAGTMEVSNDEKKNIRFWTLDQFNVFAAKIKDKMYHLIYDILYWCGLRRGEVLGLRLMDIDLDGGKISIEKNKVKLNYGGSAIQSPKTKWSRRTIGVPQKLMSEIKEYIGSMYKPAAEDYLFPLEPHTISDNFRRKQTEFGIKPRLRLHDLRHSHASLLINLGFSAQAVADRMGHRDATMVIKTYGHLFPAKRDEITEALNRIS